MNSKRAPLRRMTGIMAVVTAGLLALSACAPPSGADSTEETPVADLPAKPSAPVALNIIDGGSKVASEAAIAQFAKDNPDIISSVTWESTSEGDVAGALKPQIESGNLKVDLVVTGASGLAAGIENDLWLPIARDYGDRLSNMANYLPEGEELQELAEDYGVAYVWAYGGPTIEYNPKEVTGDLPKTPEELLTWVSEHPGEFGYARPANSGVGRSFLLSLPYILGDKDPNDPQNGWDKTWAYLEELGQYIDNYPTATSQSMENLANGTWTLMPSSAGWDEGPRSRGQVPEWMEGYALDDTTWVMDANYMLVPRGVSDDTLSALLLLIDYMLSPEGNATVGASVQYIPGTIVENVTEDMVPQETRDLLSEYGRDWKTVFDESDHVAQPAADVVVEALDLWDRKIGAAANG